jgi:DNA-binding NarL/FixJ family response regulator
MGSDSRANIDALVRIVLVDDHRLFRELIKSYLESIVGFSVVAEADNGNDAVAYVKMHRPHVCIMDITLKGLDGFEATKKIIKYGKTNVLVVSASTKPECIRRMIAAGAKGYLFKDSSPEILCEAVRAVAAGMTYYPMERDAAGVGGKKQGLSEREMQFIRLICDSRSLNEIANELNLSYSTVVSYKTRAMMKTGTNTTAELVKYAIKNGIAQLE